MANWSTPSDFAVQKLVDENDWNAGLGASSNLIVLKDAMNTITSSAPARALGNTYQNTTALPMMVSISASTTIAGQVGLQLNIGIAATASTLIADASTTTGAGVPIVNVIGLVPSQYYYKTVTFQANLKAWYEWTFFAT